MNLLSQQAASPGGDNKTAGAAEAASAPSAYTIGEVGFGPLWDEDRGLRELYDEAQAQMAIYEVERGILEKELRRLREEVAKYRATRLTDEDEQILAKGHQGHAKAAVTEGGTGYSWAERPEPSPQLGQTPETDAALLDSDCTYNCGHSFAYVDSLDDIAHGNSGIVVLADFARKLERERNELREVMAEIVTWIEDDLRDTVDASYRKAVERAQKLTEGLR